MRYFIGGFSWNGESQYDRFIKHGIWENGYEQEKYAGLFSQISVGDLFALKSTFVKGRKPNAKSMLRIKNIGVVTKILSTSSIQIDWKESNEFDLTDIKWYANTIEEISYSGDIQRIFGNLKNKLQIMNHKHILQYKKQIILQGPPGTGKTRQAKELAGQLLGLNDTKKLKDNPQFKIIQFHPSYTYEDFVRGIVAKPNPVGQGVLYVAENKTLGEFARRATDNYNDSKKAPEEISKVNWIRENYEKFKEVLETELGEKGEIIIKDNTKPKIISIEENAIRVNRYSNENDSVLIKDSDIIEGYKGLHLSEPAVKIKENLVLSKSARSGMYYLYQNLIEKFKKYLDENHISFTQNTINKRQELKPYVLVIDEINRANLSSVLGELIYALEYRGKAVESIYDVDGNDLILPPNLYIIGTMNTADRSVGHIDYAIRRRFAFIDVLPEPLEDDEHIHFNNEGFKKVSKLFKNGNVSGEFEAKDVQLGHSYFIAKKEDIRDGQTKEEIFRIKMNYEVVPILLEYVKDGVLIGTFEDKENNNKKYDIKDYINTLKTNN